MALLPKLPDDVKDDKQLMDFLRGITQVLDDNENEKNNIVSNISSTIHIPYAPYYVQTSAPSNPYNGWLWYNTSTNKLYRYNSTITNWQEINWQKIVKMSPEWQAGKLRVSSGVLQITPNSGTNWYNCYPCVGSNTIRITDTSYKYYLLPGNSAHIPKSIYLPIVAINNMSFRAMLYEYGTGTYYWGLKFNDTLSQGSLMASIYRNDLNLGSSISDSFDILTLGYSKSTIIGRSLVNSTMYLYQERIISTSVSQSYDPTYGAFVVSSIHIKSSTAYWMGTYSIPNGAGTPSCETLITRLT